MKKNIQEMILLYNFTEDRVVEIKDFLEKMNIQVKVLPKEEYYQKIGYIFELKGFAKAVATTDENFSFGYELMMLHNFSKPRLDNVLKQMRAQNIEVPICKAMVTMFNRFWTVEKVCNALEKEHLAMKNK